MLGSVFSFPFDKLAGVLFGPQFDATAYAECALCVSNINHICNSCRYTFSPERVVFCVHVCACAEQEIRRSRKSFISPAR